jgi:predicted Ser/Thr protein kinase
VGAPLGLCPECLLNAGLSSIAGGDTSPQATPPPTPAELASRFPQLEILELLGRGGMGAVYKTRQISLGRLVALKILPPAFGSSPVFAERFTREARALAQLNHHGIVTLYEFGQTDDGLFYFLMEFVDGMNLRQLLAGGRIAPREALAIVPELCDALQYAHDRGMVHRDIKPENILLDRRGRVKIADFGLAKLVAMEESALPDGKGVSMNVALTEAGKVMGTPSYMAPEQSERPAEVDHRADIYALGVVFYQMLTGDLPPDGKVEPPSRKVLLDVRLDEVVLRALEKDPSRRYQEAKALKTEVETISETSAPPSIPPPAVAGAVLKFARGPYTTPEFLATTYGGFIGLKGKGELSLQTDRLLFVSDGERTEIPLTRIRQVCVARGPRWISPAGHAFLLIAYEKEGRNQRLLFRPGESFFRSAPDTQDVAAEWVIAIRDALHNAGVELLPADSHVLVVVPGSRQGALTVAGLLFLPIGMMLWGELRTGRFHLMEFWIPISIPGVLILAFLISSWLSEKAMQTRLLKRISASRSPLLGIIGLGFLLLNISSPRSDGPRPFEAWNESTQIPSIVPADAGGNSKGGPQAESPAVALTR